MQVINFIIGLVVGATIYWFAIRPVRQEIKDNIRLYYNKIRIWYLKRFTDKVQTYEFKDNDGSTRKVTTEKQVEKTCAHTKIEQVYGTFWRCMECPHVFFEISYKVMLSRQDLVGFAEKIADMLGAELTDKKETDDRQPKPPAA